MRVTDERAGSGHAAGLRPWVALVALVYLLLVGVAVIGEGFKWLSGGADGAERLFAFAVNPIVGVIVGVLATALVQSSSTVTAVIVGLVAGGAPVSIAVPMVMGANMGTSITNTIVSLGNLRERGAFRRSFEAATVHDFFNLYSIVVFLPIEILFHPLERMAARLADLTVGSASASMSELNVLGMVTRPVATSIAGLLQGLGTPGAVLTIAIGIGCIFASVIYLGTLLRSLMQGRAKGIVDRAIGRGPVSGVVAGTLVTMLVQSSSTTTSLVVPLAGAGTLTLRQIYPFTLGANIGTCITALLAATAIAGPTEVFAMQIALVHLLYNVCGVALFLSVPWVKELPMRTARWLGGRVELNRLWALGYVGAVFFVLPGAVFAGQSTFGAPRREIVAAESDGAALEAAEAVVIENEVAIE